ncbi:MAG: aminodeoxychorismate synthase component I [Chthoniobacterales bacterium]
MPKLTKSKIKKSNLNTSVDDFLISQKTNILSFERGQSSFHRPIEPIDLARQLCKYPDFVFLDSSQTGQHFSILAHSPTKKITGNLFEDQKLDTAVTSRQIASPSPSSPFPNAAFIGTFDFDGSYHFGFYEKIFIFDHSKQTWLSPPSKKDFPRPAPQKSSESSEKFRLHLQPSISKNEYLKMIHRAKEYIAAGDIYQACLAYPHCGSFDGTPWDLYQSWRHHSPAPHAAFLDQDNRYVLSASPECFFHLTGRKLYTRPIKGTRPRNPDSNEDRRLAYELQSSAKENAELLMITDLERNDLGRICEFGSVKVQELIKLETFPHVFHLVSTIQGQLRSSISPTEAFRKCFPGGSISGAPKKRALEIIKELEPSPRGLFTGAIGYFGTNGDAQFNIAIRTLTLEKNSRQPLRAEYWTGAGIVADSQAQDEWEETHHKASGLLSTLNHASVE